MIHVTYDERKTLLYALQEACSKMDDLIAELEDGVKANDRVAKMLTNEFTRYKKQMANLGESFEVLFDSHYLVFVTNREFEELSLTSCDDDEEKE